MEWSYMYRYQIDVATNLTHLTHVNIASMAKTYIIVFNVMHYIFAWNETEIFLPIPINT